jgi:low affinity Fe/Cu permease
VLGAIYQVRPACRAKFARHQSRLNEGEVVQRTVTRFADRITELTGRPWAWILSLSVVLIWALGLFHFGLHDPNYILVIETLSSIVTLLMVFLIQHSTERSNRAIQLKLDALIGAQENTEKNIIGVEDRPAVEIKRIQEEAREQLYEAENNDEDGGR